MLRFWLTVVSALVLLAAPFGEPTRPALASDAEAPDSLSAPDLATLRTIQSQVSAIRGLSVEAEPDLRVLDHAALHQYLADEFERDYLVSERESDQKELTLLGLIKPADDLVKMQLGLLSDQVIGVYDTDARSMVVVGDQGPFGALQKITYAHEFNHALQDQHYDLSKVAPRHSASNDQSLAARALIEGDAVLLQTLWAQANLSADELAQVIAGSSGSGDSLASVPPVVRSELLFPYTEGFSFVRQAYGQAGNDYAAVDAIFLNPPESTAQVLHPEKYRAQVHPVPVSMPDLATRLGNSWQNINTGVVGELDTRVLLEQWGSPHAEAARVASAWSGDAWQLVGQDGRTAIVLHSTWDSPDGAQGFFNAYARGLRTRFPDATVDESLSTHQALTGPGTATELRVSGNDVVAVVAFDRDAARALEAAATSSAP